MENLNRKLKESKSEHTEIEYLKRILKVNNSLFRLDKGLEEDV